MQVRQGKSRQVGTIGRVIGAIMGTQPLPSGYVLPKATNSDEYEERAALLTGDYFGGGDADTN